MRERLIQHVEQLFAGAPGAEDIKQEILQNTLDRFDDLISQGKTEEAAYRLAISGIGDINEILGSFPPSPPVSAPGGKRDQGRTDTEIRTKKRSGNTLRIILIGLAVFLVGCIALTALGIGIFSVYDRREIVTHADQLLQSDLMYPEDFDANRISCIEIVWAAGEIRIEPVDNLTAIQVRESQAEEKYKMVCSVSGDTLKIQFCRESLKFPSFGVDSVAKDLVITVPADWICHELDIDAAAANVTIRNLTVGELDFDGASGHCTLENCHVTDVDVEAASGDLIFSGTLDTLEFDGASANCTLNLTNCPSHIAMNGMSGQLDITLPSDCGFTAKTDGLSCKFFTDFPVSSQGDAHHYGDRNCLIQVETLSGTVNIHDSGYTCHEGQEGHHSNSSN